MCAQGAVWYFTFFYLQVFLERSLGLPSQTKDLLLIVMTVVSAPLYVYFGWLSDRIGRKPVMVGGMLLALVLYFPGVALDRRCRQSGAGRGAGRNAGLRRDRSQRPARSSSIRSAPPSSSAPATSPRARWSPRASRSGPDLGRRQTRVVIGPKPCRSPSGDGLAAPELKALKAKTADTIGAELAARRLSEERRSRRRRT